jgi:molybdopterin-containing oxidoreductase family iron-sulfur binding subunit
MSDSTPLDLDAIRRRLATSDGRRFWRSLDEVAETPAFVELLQHEFPRQAMPIAGGVDRRQFLRLMSASLALAGLGACTRQPPEEIVPYAKAPESVLVPGEPLFFATAMPLAGGALGLLVESHMGRPTKIEGNPEHPASLGATDVYAQASVLELYDPDRSQVITSAGEIRPWGAFVETLRAALEAQRAKDGAGLRILTETIASPTLRQQMLDLLAAYPAAKWVQYDPLRRDWHGDPLRREGGVTAARDSLPVDVHHRLAGADIILALDSDFLACGPDAVRLVREFCARRRPGADTTMSRLYVAEPMPTVTGGRADHRLPLRASEVEDVAWAIAAAVGVARASPGPASRPYAAWIAAVARDLVAHRGTSVVIAGDAQPPLVHAAAYAINQALGNVGRTIVYGEPVTPPSDAVTSLRQLADDMEAGAVEVLIILHGNPVVTAPADLEFAQRLDKVQLRVRLGLYDDETSVLCHWHVPAAHFLESWSDVRARDGTVTIIQPLIAPLYDGMTAHELVATCLATDGAPPSVYDVVRDYWKGQHPGADFETFWRKALHDGVVPGTAGAFEPATMRSLAAIAALRPDPLGRARAHQGGVVPGQLRHRPGHLLQPAVVGKATIV